MKGFVAAVVAFGVLGLPLPAAAQAWLPPKREGNISITYQDTLARGHLTPDGQKASGASGSDPVRAHAASLEADFGVTDRLALNLALPYITARYGGPNPHRLGVHGQATSIDDGSYHGGLQDFRLGARLSLDTRPLFITPFAEVIVPSRHYESRGHSVIGLDMRALVLGANLGRFLDPVLPRAYMQVQGSHAIVEKVAGVRPNRSRLDAEIGYFVTPRLAVRVLESFQRTHDGVDFPYAGLPTDLALNHDRLSRNNFLNLGVGLAWAVNDSWDLFATGVTLVWGQNVHPHRGIAIGMNWHFRSGSAAAAASPQITPNPGGALDRARQAYLSPAAR